MQLANTVETQFHTSGHDVLWKFQDIISRYDLFQQRYLQDCLVNFMCAEAELASDPAQVTGKIPCVGFGVSKERYARKMENPGCAI